MTAKMLLEQYMAERHALGFVSKTDEGCIRRFLRDYKEPEDGKIVFSKEYVLEHIGTGLNQKANTVLRDVSAINGFLNLPPFRCHLVRRSRHQRFPPQLARS